MRGILLASAWCVSFACVPAVADSMTFPITTERDYITVNVNIKDKAGNPTVLKAFIDTGANGGFGITPDAAASLGLTATGSHTVTGAGGEIIAGQTNIPASNAGTITGGGGTFNVSVQGAGHILPNLPPGYQMILGNNFLNPDPAGKGAIKVNEAKGTMTVYNHEQALKLSALELNREVIAVALGSLNTDPSGTAYAVDGLVNFGDRTASFPFVISTGISPTLISASLASELGVPLDGPLVTVVGEFSTFTVPSASIGMDIFPGLGSQSVQVGILPDSLNPMGVNVLGGGFLSQFTEFDINGSTLTFSASPVPEPDSVTLCAVGLLAILTIRGIGCGAQRSPRAGSC